MKIIHLSDFNCPYSYIGLNRIANACAELDLDVEWEMVSFELEPNIDSISTVDRFAIKSGLSLKDAEREIEKIEQIAENEGLNINYDMVLRSSKDAHRLVKYVQNKNYPVSHELIFKIFESNLTKNENIA